MNSPADEIVLSAEQLDAIEADNRALVVVASAGSGKTEVVARRVQRLLEYADPTTGRILVLSYTVKAADELRNRLRDRAGNLIRYVDAETVHSFAHTLLRQHGTKIGLPLEPELLTRDEDRAELMNGWLASQGLEPLRDPLAELRKIDLSRARLDPDPRADEWEQALASVSALDYPALIASARRLLGLRSTRRQLARVYSHVIIDEAQNLTPAQYDLIVSLLGEPNSTDGPSAMLVGDDKQSIISFAGADPGLIQRFGQDYQAKMIRLTANFRSARQISQLATRIAEDLGHSASSRPTHAAAGLIERREGRDESHEARIVADWVEGLLANGIPPEAMAPNDKASILPEEIAVLGRSAPALRHVASELESRAIEFSTASGSSEWLEGKPAMVALEIVSLRSASDHKSTHWQLARLLETSPHRVETLAMLQDLLARHDEEMLRMLVPLIAAESVSDFVRIMSNLDVPKNAKTEELVAWNADIDQMVAAWDEFDRSTDRASLTWGNFKLHCSRRQRGDEGRGVKLLTIHKSQGREFLAVSVVGLNDGQLPDFRAKTREDRDAELRTFYVAVTRSRRVLLLTRPRSRMTRYGARSSTPSPFLDFLPDSGRSG